MKEKLITMKMYATKVQNIYPMKMKTKSKYLSLSDKHFSLAKVKGSKKGLDCSQ